MNIKRLIAALLVFSMVSFSPLGVMAKTKTGEPQPVLQDSSNTVLPGSVSESARVEHMPKQKNVYLNTVKIQNGKALIAQGNTIKIKFAQEFNSKYAKTGDKVIFILDEELATQEGTKLFPSGTQIIGTVEGVEPPMWWNKNAKVLMSLGEVKLPNGQSGRINARIYSKDSTLRRTGWATFGKIAGWTVGLFGVGAGIGAGIGAAASAVGIGCFAIGMPVGGGIGLIVSGITPGQHYKVKPGKEIPIQLTQDLEISLAKI